MKSGKRKYLKKKKIHTQSEAWEFFTDDDLKEHTKNISDFPATRKQNGTRQR